MGWRNLFSSPQFICISDGFWLILLSTIMYRTNYYIYNLATLVLYLLIAPVPLFGQTPSTDINTVQQPAKQSSVWTLTSPLGLHKTAEFDTLPYNYQQRFIPSLASGTYATTGNYGAEGQTQIFFDRPSVSQFFFKDALSRWLPNISELQFYNVYTPFTQLSYNTGGSKQTTQDHLKVKFAGNANRRVGIGANLDYIYSKGSYANQADKDFIFGFTGYYRGDRYEMQAFYNHWNMLNKENGGITDALYITDPAQLQGGVSKIEPKSIPVNLSAAHSRITGQQLYINQAYNVGYWREEAVNDTLSRNVYVPMSKFIWTLDYSSDHHLFLNSKADDAIKFWDNTYYNSTKTRDDTRYWQLSNTVGIQLIEGFRKWVKFGLSAYATYTMRHATSGTIESEQSGSYTGELTPLPSSMPQRKGTENLLYIGAQLTKLHGSLINYFIDGKLGLSGEAVGDIDINGHISSRFRMLGDTVNISALGHFRNTSQPFLINNYISNHFIWHNDFGKTRSFRAAGELLIPWTRTTLNAGVENIQNYVYFDPQSLPKQYTGSIQVFSASLDQRLRFGIWNWDNALTLQTTSNADILPLPLLSIYSNMYLSFTAFNVLHVQLGIDCNWYSAYYAPSYQPATMSFHTQHDTKVGNYPFMDAYVNCKLKKVRFYVMWSHFNQGMFSKDYFSMPLYPLNPRRFQIGLSIDFLN